MTDGIVVRPARREDIEAVCALVRTVDEVDYGAPDTNLQDIEADWALPRFDLARDARVAERGGALIGYAWTWERKPGVQVVADTAVHPDAPAGLLDTLLDVNEARAAALRVGGARDLVLLVPVAERDVQKAQALRARGYTYSRSYMRLAAVVTDPVAVRWPQGVERRAFRSGVDDDVLYDVVEEAFRDHPEPLQDTREDWLQRVRGHPDFDPQHCALAFEGDEPVGAIVGYDHGDVGYVRFLGVRPAWRGRGVAVSLLADAFQRFFSTGQGRVELDVDSSNETGALRLYERAGMTLKFRTDFYERTLQGAPAGGASDVRR